MRTEPQRIGSALGCAHETAAVITLVRKVKCTLVQALRLCTGRTALRGSRGIALPFHDHGTRRGWGVSVTSRPLFTPGKDPVPIVQEAGWAPGPVWTGAENLTHTGVRSPDRPARSQSLYRLRYPTHYYTGDFFKSGVCVSKAMDRTRCVRKFYQHLQILSQDLFFLLKPGNWSRHSDYARDSKTEQSYFDYRQE